MRRWLVIIMALVAFPGAMVTAEIVTDRFDMIGADGMQTNYNFKTLLPTQLRYQLNVDTWTQPGLALRRRGLIRIIKNVYPLYGAYSYYTKDMSKFVTIGICDNPTYSKLGVFYYTDTTGGSGNADLQANIIEQNMYPYTNATHDWTYIDNEIIHADGKMLPIIFTFYKSQKKHQKIGDTIGFSPRVVSMGLEAPGQLRASVIDTTGPLTGYYTYAVAYKGTPGKPSAVVVTENQRVALTGFPSAEDSLHGTNWLTILRAKVYDYIVGSSSPEWYIIDSIENPQDSFQFVYIDTNQGTVIVIDTLVVNGVDTLNNDTIDNILYWYHYRFATQPRWASCVLPDNWERYYNFDSITANDTFWTGGNPVVCPSPMDDCPYAPCDIDSVYDSITTTGWSVVVDTTTLKRWDKEGNPIPGQLIKITDTADTNSLCRVAYSIYDPVLNIESPLGPSIACGYDSVNDTTKGTFRTGIVRDGLDGYYLRFYQTITNPLIAGGTDTTVWYGTIQARAYNLLNHDDTITYLWPETSVVNGLDTADVADTNVYPYHFFRTITGDVVTLPPYHYANTIPFSDIEYVNGRLWGIGDPLYPERLYWSEVNYPAGNAYNWNLNNYIELKEGIGGALIALVSMPEYGSSALYAFKKTGIYMIDADPYSLSVRLLPTKVGVNKKRHIVKFGGDVYFYGSDGRIYRLNGNSLEDISDPIYNLLSESHSYTFACRDNDNIEFVDTTNETSFIYNPKRGTWGVNKYYNYAPIGSYPIGTNYYYYNNSDDYITIKSDNYRGWDWLTLGFDSLTKFDCAWQLPYVGDGINNWRIQQIDMIIGGEAYSGYKLYYTIYNEFGDSLLTDSIIFPSGYDGSISVHVPYNEGKYLSIKLWVSLEEETPLLTKNFYPKEVIIKRRNMGLSRVNQ